MLLYIKNIKCDGEKHNKDFNISEHHFSFFAHLNHVRAKKNTDIACASNRDCNKMNLKWRNIRGYRLYWLKQLIQKLIQITYKYYFVECVLNLFKSLLFYNFFPLISVANI